VLAHDDVRLVNVVAFISMSNGRRATVASLAADVGLRPGEIIAWEWEL